MEGCILPRGLSPLPNKSPAPRSSLFPPALLGGPRDPPSLRAASAQSRVGGGEGPYRGPLAGRVPRAGHAEEALRRAGQLQRPQSWVLRVFSVVKPTSRNLSASSARLTWDSQRKTQGPRATVLCPTYSTDSVSPATRTSAPSRSRAGSAAPKLVPVQRAGRRDSAALGAQPAVWFELGLWKGCCGRGHCIPPGHWRRPGR